MQSRISLPQILVTGTDGGLVWRQPGLQRFLMSRRSPLLLIPLGPPATPPPTGNPVPLGSPGMAFLATRDLPPRGLMASVNAFRPCAYTLPWSCRLR